MQAIHWILIILFTENNSLKKTILCAMENWVFFFQIEVYK